MKDLKGHVLKGMVQTLIIGVVSCVVALAVNAARTDGLPLINKIETNIPSAIDGSVSNTPSIVSVKDALPMLMRKKAIFLDARDGHEYEKYHIPGAIHIEPGKTEGKIEKIKAIKTELFIAYCYGPGCPLAEELADELMVKGIRNIAVMPEGWDGWLSAGYPEEGNLQ